MKMSVLGKVIETKQIEGAGHIQKVLVACGDAGEWRGFVGKDIMVGQLVTVFLPEEVLPKDERWASMESHNAP